MTRKSLFNTSCRQRAVARACNKCLDRLRSRWGMGNYALPRYAVNEVESVATGTTIPAYVCPPHLAYVCPPHSLHLSLYSWISARKG